ncbi:MULTISPECIES: hypothetical protein [Nesterenkonia]|nr:MULTISPECIES: hypothetical protein [Nesterenkonia]
MNTLIPMNEACYELDMNKKSILKRTVASIGVMGVAAAGGLLGAAPASASVALPASSVGCQSISNPPMNCEVREIDEQQARKQLQCYSATGIGTVFGGPKAGIAAGLTCASGHLFSY